jgi:hypothetical protein
MFALLALQALEVPPSGLVQFSAALEGRGERLRGPALLLELGGERLVATRQSAWTRIDRAGEEQPIELAEWTRIVSDARLDLPTGPLALGGPARGGLDEWWCDVLLLELGLEAPAEGQAPAAAVQPEAARLPSAAPLRSEAPRPGERLYLAGRPGSARAVEVASLQQDPGLPALELHCTHSSATEDLLGLPLFDAQGRAVALVSEQGRSEGQGWLRAQSLAPALALPAPLRERRLDLRTPAGLFDRLSASGDRILLSSNLFERTLGRALDGGSVGNFESWDQYRGVHFSPDGLFAVGMHPVRGIEWAEALGLDVLSRYGRLFDRLGALEFAPDGARLFAAEAGDQGLFELELGSDLARRLAPLGGELLAVGPGGDWLAIGGGPRGREVELLSTAAPEAVRLARWELPAEPAALAAAPDAALLALAAGSNLELLAGPQWQPRWRVELGPGNIRALHFEPGGQHLWVALGRLAETDAETRFTDGCWVSLLSLEDGRELARSQRLADLPFDLCAFGPGRVLVGDQSGRLTECRLPAAR